MASSSSSSDNPLSKDTMSKEEERFATKKSTPNCLTLLPFSAPPHFRQPAPPHLKPNLQLLKVAATHVATQLHDSILISADKFLSMLHGLASQNPLLCRLLSFSSHLQSFSSQMRCRNYGHLDARSNHNFAAVLLGDSVAGIVVTNGILNFLNIYNTLLIVRLVLTWFPNAPPAVVSPLSTICDPYLNIFRGIIPPLGGTLDLSPILAFLVLNAFTSTAAALPAELPPTGVSERLPSRTTVSPFTTSQKKWIRRLSSVKSKNSSGEN
ncbi:ylmG homolog protein 2, chloroplastic [Coffea eugenioides]|uniref:YlmG homolog protein 2, chloroplastic n=1 Tax=Coffea arabica TaxID=13443 RepID=A0A6P6TQY7_COFAR|nr:ylmG homolog protein 2, chloroplastic-like [Coffea arabica]XP_027180959.1 ylmG homolog protein 2, chloroplastic [Coffea eugenioides]